MHGEKINDSEKVSNNYKENKLRRKMKWKRLDRKGDRNGTDRKQWERYIR